VGRRLIPKPVARGVDCRLRPARISHSMAGNLVIAIDGPVGAGKSAVARALAKRLGFRYLDSGAMYRAVTLKALRLGVDMRDEAALTRVAQESDIELKAAPGGVRVLLDGEDVSGPVRSLEVTNSAFGPSQTPGVRTRMVELQRGASSGGPLVAEGRDMGTVVFPGAPAKFFLDASVAERAKRRYAEHVAKGESISMEELKRQIVLRDERDSTREASPLKKADDAVSIDTSNMTIDEVVESIVSVLTARGLLSAE